MNRMGLLMGVSAVSTAALLVLCYSQGSQERKPEVPAGIENWQLDDLANYVVRQANTPLRMIEEPGELRAVYLTENPKESYESCTWKWHQPKCINEWHGTVVVRYTEYRGSRLAVAAGDRDYYFQTGNFTLFGDPDLLKRIRAILETPVR